ncbi:MAG TPA: cytochrome c1 [Pseudomonadales bacterium]|nr:cytochrome c1 [Pseudomonadales bacterium]
MNNRVFADVAMPHAMAELQGVPECVAAGEHKCATLAVGQAGSMTSAEFDAVAADLTNFLAYVAEPMAPERKRLGVYALLFVVVFGIFAYLLNREYWKDVH